MRILLTSGGTGGHIYATVAIARTLKKISESQNYSMEMLFVGPDKFTEVKSKKIFAGKIRRYFSLDNIVDIFKIFIGFWQSFWFVFWFMPDVIFGKGGYGSFSVILVGLLFNIPTIIHESDSVPGLTNRIFSPLVKRITFSFSVSEKYFSPKKRLFSGHPIRKEVLAAKKEEVKMKFNLVGDRPILFFIGGSQGAQKINEVVLEALSKLLEKYEVIHQSGDNNFKEVKSESDGLILAQKLDSRYYHLFANLSDLEVGSAYAASDLIIARSGAGTIFEIAAWGKPSILVPLPSAAANHQVKNAYEFSSGEKAIVFEEANFTPNFVLQEINNLFDDRERLVKIGENAKKFAVLNSAEIISNEIIKMAS